MKVYMIPIAMVASFTGTGKPTPVRFKMPESSSVIKVDRVLVQDEEKLAGNRMLIFRCASCVDGLEKNYELKYEIATCKWYLYKM